MLPVYLKINKTESFLSIFIAYINFMLNQPAVIIVNKTKNKSSHTDVALTSWKVCN